MRRREGRRAGGPNFGQALSFCELKGCSNLFFVWSFCNLPAIHPCSSTRSFFPNSTTPDVAGNIPSRLHVFTNNFVESFDVFSIPPKKEEKMQAGGREEEEFYSTASSSPPMFQQKKRRDGDGCGIEGRDLESRRSTVIPLRMVSQGGKGGGMDVSFHRALFRFFCILSSCLWSPSAPSLSLSTVLLFFLVVRARGPFCFVSAYFCLTSGWRLFWWFLAIFSSF